MALTDSLQIAAREHRMEEVLRYGVFQLADRWSVVSSDGHAVGFPTRSRAIAAARTLASVHQACGNPSEVLVQDDLGRLKVLPLREPEASDAYEEPRLRRIEIHAAGKASAQTGA